MRLTLYAGTGGMLRYMRTSDRNNQRSRGGPAGWPAVLGVGVLLVLCCAGPALVAAGALGVLGAVSRDAWLFVAAAALFAAAVGWTAWWRRRLGYRASRSAPPAGLCCPPDSSEPDSNRRRRD